MLDASMRPPPGPYLLFLVTGDGVPSVGADRAAAV